MNRRFFPSLVPLLLSLLFGSPSASSSAERDRARPNLIAIVTDDQARWAMGLYGNADIRTPHMDRIGREGAVFANAFTVTPVCSPSRAAYLTGRWPTELGITDWIAPEEARDGLGLKATTWPQVLQQNGYRTGLVGKWHLGEQPEFHPTRMGFDHFMGFLGGGNRPMDPTLEVDGEQRQLSGSLPDILTDDAIRFIGRQDERPFALCLHFRAPHTPYGPVPEIDSSQYDDLDPDVEIPRGANPAQLKQWHREYYASVSSADRNIGRLLAELDRLGLTENTIVLFTSDHGYNLGRHLINAKGNGAWIAGGVTGPKRPNMWDTSIRVPLVIRWPAVVKPGTRVDHIVSNLDAFRTILGLLSVPLPAGTQARGIDFSPLLRGEPPADESDGVLFGQYDLHNGGLAYMRMIRTQQYKLVRHFKANGLDELYDLEADPGETRNLFNRRAGDRHQSIVSELQSRLTRWQESIDDPLLKSTY